MFDFFPFGDIIGMLKFRRSGADWKNIEYMAGHRLVGDVEISGAKNAVVAILPAVILADGVCRIENIPNIMDVATSLEILSSIGAQVRPLNKNTVEIDPRPISTHVVPHDLARTCGLLIISSARCWAGSARRGFPCRAAAISACGPSISI